MDIRQAIEHVAYLAGQIRDLDKALAQSTTLEYGSPCQVTARVLVRNHGIEDVILDRDAAINLLRKTKEHYQAEVDRLQPVIDMANAALRGLEK